MELANMNIPCGCDNRRQIMGQGEWKIDAALIASGAIALTLAHGGTMSNKTSRLLTIAFVGAVGALIVDGFLKPKVGAT